MAVAVGFHLHPHIRLGDAERGGGAGVMREGGSRKPKARESNHSKSKLSHIHSSNNVSRQHRRGK
jgi:hypothetical protein